MFSDVYNFKSPIHRIMFHGEKNTLIVFTESYEMAQFFLMDDDTFSLRSRVKLSMPAQRFSLDWIERGIVVCASGENFLRFWDLNNDNTTVLALPERQNTSSPGLACVVSFNNTNESLVASSSDGTISVWKLSSISSTQWDLYYTERFSTFQGGIQKITSSSNGDSIAVNCHDGVYILQKEPFRHTYSEGAAAIQCGSDRIIFEHLGGSQPMQIASHIAIEGMVCDDRHVVIWNGDNINVFRIFETHAELFSDLHIKSNSVAMKNDTLYVVSGDELLVLSLMGVQRCPNKKFSKEEGAPMYLNRTMNFLVVLTTNKIAHIFDVSKTEPYLLQKPQHLESSMRHESLGEVISIKCNSNGSILSLLVCDGTGRNSLYCYHLRNEVLLRISCGNCSPISHFWDPAEAKLFAVEVAPLLNDKLVSNAPN